MRKVLLFLSLFVCCSPGANAKYYKGRKVDMYNRRHYFMSLGAVNPLSAFQKYGGQLEFRNGNVSEVLSYTKYISAYPGTQYAFEIQKYLPTHGRDQYYIYLRGIYGDVLFDSRKLSVYGDNSKVLVANYDANMNPTPAVNIIGGAFGFGRRYNFNSLFIRWNAGIRVCSLGEFTGDYDHRVKHMFRLMYVTGPASIVEFNVHIGLQL